MHIPDAPSQCRRDSLREKANTKEPGVQASTPAMQPRSSPQSAASLNPPASFMSAAPQPGSLISMAHALTAHTLSPSVTNATSQPGSLISAAPEMTSTVPRQPTPTLQKRSNAEALVSGVHAPNAVPPIVRAGDDHEYDQFENREVRQKRINYQGPVSI